MNPQCDPKLDATIVHVRTAHADQRVELELELDAILERHSS